MKTLQMVAALIMPLSYIYSSDFDVDIDGKRYLFTDGMQQQVPLKSGERISITVTAAKDKLFSDSGFSFRYPAEVKLSQESGFGARVIQLETTESAILMILVYPEKSTSPADAEKELIASLQQQYKSMGVNYSEKSLTSTQRKIGADLRNGQRLSFLIGGIPHETEFYSFTYSGKTFAWCFQVPTEDKLSSEPLFQKVSGSFK